MLAETNQVDLAHVAHLARLQLTDAELARFAAQLKDILAYVAKLNELDVTGVEPMAHAVPLTNVLRADEVRPSLTTAEALQSAPRHDGECFLVPAVLGESGAA